MEGLVPEIFLGSVPVTAAVIVLVESLKRLGFAGDKLWLTAQKAAILSGLGFGLVVLVATPDAFTNAQQAIVVGTSAILGGLQAGLGYDLVGDAFFARLQSVLNAAFGVE